MLGEFIRDKRVICVLAVIAIWGIFHGVSYINEQQKKPARLLYGLQGEARINAALPLLLSLGADDKIGGCHGKITGETPERKLDMEGRKIFFTEKGWKDYQEFATRIKQKLTRGHAATGLQGVRLQEFLPGKTYKDVIYHLDIQLRNSSCGGAGENDYDIYLSLVSEGSGTSEAIKIDGWEVKSYPLVVDFSISY